MSVDCEARLMYGWVLEAEDIPDFDLHYKHDWEDLFDIPKHYIVLNGRETKLWPCDVVMNDSGYEEPEKVGWYVGIPLGNGFTKEEFMRQLDETQAREIYKCVMGREPDTAPEVLSFAQWC